MRREDEKQKKLHLSFCAINEGHVRWTSCNTKTKFHVLSPQFLTLTLNNTMFSLGVAQPEVGRK
uniref:Uncharacterized protein n=1 Tax=Romanomermis culicivorax TaxID=13658 RepID=A0A915K668_ROMCU